MAPVEQDTVPLSAGLAAPETVVAVVVVVVAKEVSSDHREVPALRTYSGCLQTDNGDKSYRINPIALRTAKTLLSFGHSECSRVNIVLTSFDILFH